MENLKIYDSVRKVPDAAKRPISAGRLKGKTDINPMWRIKSLTEAFGPCGIGWKYTITDKRLEPGANGEISAFVDINLYVKVGGEWSDAIPGTGGSAFVAREKSGLYTSDECFKMALTDAISVACKALGMGADVYWDADRTKYSAPPAEQQQQESAPPAEQQQQETAKPRICSDCGKQILDAKRPSGKIWYADDIERYTTKLFGRPLCNACGNAEAMRGREDPNENAD